MTFALNKPFASAAPTVAVDPGLKPGVYRFQLVVVDDHGLQSAPAFVNVRVLDGQVPTHPIDPVILTPIPLPHPVPILTPIPPVGPIGPLPTPIHG